MVYTLRSCCSFLLSKSHPHLELSGIATHTRLSRQAYAADPNQLPLYKPKTQALSYVGDPTLRFGAVSFDGTPLSNVATSKSLNLRWSSQKWQASTGGQYRVFYDNAVPFSAVVGNVISSPTFVINADPLWLIPTSGDRIQSTVNVPQFAAQDSTGFVLKMSYQDTSGATSNYPNDFSFIAASTNVDSYGVGYVAGAVTADGPKVYQGYGQDTHFDSFSYGDDGLFTLKLTNNGRGQESLDPLAHT